MCHCFHGEINIAQSLQGLLLDHIIEEATGAAALHKGKRKHQQHSRTQGYKRRETEGDRQVGGGETQLFQLSPPLIPTGVLSLFLCVL